MTASAPQRFTGRTALLGAAGSGIGAATARRLAAEGASVLVTDVNPESAHRVAEEIRAQGGQARDLRLDATEPADWAAAVEAAASWTGRLDVLHLNAARQLHTAAHELDDGDWQDQMRVSLGSAFYGARAAVPLLGESGAGAVVVTSSVHAVIGFRGYPAYAAAKSGLCGLVRQLAVQYGGRIRFNAVLPGAIITPAWEEVTPEGLARLEGLTPAGRVGVPEDIAAAVAFLASDDASFITGQSLVVDGGRSISAHE